MKFPHLLSRVVVDDKRLPALLSLSNPLHGLRTEALGEAPQDGEEALGEGHLAPAWWSGAGVFVPGVSRCSQCQAPSEGADFQGRRTYKGDMSCIKFMTFIASLSSAAL